MEEGRSQSTPFLDVPRIPLLGDTWEVEPNEHLPHKNQRRPHDGQLTSGFMHHRQTLEKSRYLGGEGLVGQDRSRTLF